MPLYEIDGLLQQIRALVLELRQLEGDGADGNAVLTRRHELARLKSRLADLVTHDYSAAA
jgi:hypothetical protein